MAKSEPASVANTKADQDVVDAYVYLLDRLLVLRQEQIDFQKEGFPVERDASPGHRWDGVGQSQP